MQLFGEPKALLNDEAREFIDLYAQLGERAENFMPNRIFESLKNFVRLCYEEPDDPAKQKAEINKYILELKEAIPGYVDVSLMLFPHENSKAFEYSAKRRVFHNKLNELMDTELVDEENKKQIRNILNTHDYSLGTPPITKQTMDFLYKILLGDDANELRKFRDLIGVSEDVAEAQWNYMLDVLDQMINQSTHYTTGAEKENFLSRTESTVNFKGLNGFIRTIVSGTADTTIEIITKEVFCPEMVRVIEYSTPDNLYEQIHEDATSIFAVKIKNMRKNPFNRYQWFPFLTRIIFIDDSPESRSTNTSLIFCFHNGIINTLNIVHTKKLGALANTQLNLRLILDKVNTENLKKFRLAIEKKIREYEKELEKLKAEQLAESNNPDQDIILFKFDEFARQVIKDKYILSKFGAYISLIESVKVHKKLKNLNRDLIKEFEDRTRAYFYSENKKLHIATVVEGGGRNQIRTYSEYLLQRPLKPEIKEIIDKCRIILDIIPDAYQRTLHNHFHKNFGLNLFLEKYKEYLTKVENEADNYGRFMNLLIDLGIEEKYHKKTPTEQEVIKEFISGLGNLDRTSISDDVQMIIRDLLFYEDRKPNPFIFFNQEAAWEYKDLFPPDRFDLNPFDIEIELDDEGRVDWERLQKKLERMKSTFQLFDDTGTLWDRFCENSTLVINDPANPTGFTDFNNVFLIRFLKFLNNSKITLFLDEAYQDAVKIEDPEEPKWRTISRYIMNNIGSMAKISLISSLSTTKNLAASGDRLGSLVASPARKDIIDYARKQYGVEKGNTNSLFMLVNILENAQLVKKIKDRMDENLPKDASRHKIKDKLKNYIMAEIKRNISQRKNNNQEGSMRVSLFEGSPLHLFLLEELTSLDKLDVLELPDDFKYKGEPFFSYYKEHLTRELNKFRVNKIFRSECNKRLNLAKKIANNVLSQQNNTDKIGIIDSDGSYLFNLHLKDYFSYQDLEKFTKKLTEQRGIALIPYQKGFIRFSLGDYIEGDAESYLIFEKEFENTIRIFLKYWEIFYEEKSRPENKWVRSEDIIDEIFKTKSDKDLIKVILEDFEVIKNLEKKLNKSLKISNIKTIYHAFPKVSGVNINSIGDSKNAVFEFYENVGKCRNLTEFVFSKAFTKVYENLLPQIYKNIPLIKNLDIHYVISKYGKTTLFKYITSKLEFQPDSHLLDDPDELSVMKEILLELENILFSDAKVKILALNANEKDVSGDLAKLEGYNRILRKYIEELLLHFNLPFERESYEPTIEELVEKAGEKFEEIVGKQVTEIDLEGFANQFIRNLGINRKLEEVNLSEGFTYRLFKSLKQNILKTDKSPVSGILNLYLLQKDQLFEKKLLAKLENFAEKVKQYKYDEARLVSEDFVKNIVPQEINEIIYEILEYRKFKVTEEQLHTLTRDIVLFYIDLMNFTKSNEYYKKYNHTLIRLVETEFKRQKSSINEMIQHGIILHKNFEMENKVLETWDKGSLSWINDLLTRCGVIAWEQPVQVHTRIATDAKKREYPFHKIDRTYADIEREQRAEDSPREFIKKMETRPSSDFFARRMANFVKSMDEEDYRCKIIKRGLVKELYIFQKSYMKYLADNFRLLQTELITLDEARNFVPDVILFLGAPEKVISYPEIGYFDLKGPYGNIKTIITPLKKSVDYFGDVKKPRLTMINEKIKEMGGVPVHGSLFAVEEEDGSLFVISISGDSGAGKSEMLAAMMLKWIRHDLPGIRSIKLVAGDMFHIFPDMEGNLYGIGTEEGDFSRVNDFDPDFIRNYRSLFESSADSNVEDLNSRSTISGLCDISMPFKIDIMLTAYNFSKEEAGVKRYANPENFMLYRDSHGERKEKATSSDNPHIQRTLLRYTGDKNIVGVIDAHGNYLDDILDWEHDWFTGKHYLTSSYKMIDKIDLEDIVNRIFVDKKFGQEGKNFVIKRVKFDIIKNRFQVIAREAGEGSQEISFLLDRQFFSTIFNSIASTPAGNPFIAELGELDTKKHLVEILKGRPGGKGKGKNIQLGILSTDLGKRGKEITGPQKAAQEVKTLIQEVRILNPEINDNKNHVKQLIDKHYQHLFKHHEQSHEVWRYNFYLFQLEQMRKAILVHIDNLKDKIDLSGLKDFIPVDKGHEFSPLLVTPNINLELNGFSETYEQLMWLPNNREYAGEFYNDCEDLYVANSYSRDTIINNMVLQLLLKNGYIAIEDLARGKITEKANRETIAAAKYAVVRKLEEEEKKNV
jgi:hypothetical protein